MGPSPKKISVLFVCMGNICRSPAGEAVLRALAERRGLSNRIDCASAGTHDYHVGERSDPRMIRAGAARGYKLNGRAAHFSHLDFDRHDLILVMDAVNHRGVASCARKPGDMEKVRFMADYHPDPEVTEVPDPYYGDAEGFERVLDILESSCRRLLEELVATHGLEPGGDSA